MDNKERENVILQVPIEDIIPNRFQPRLAFDDAALKDLADSIKQHGIIQPLVLRRKNEKYEIIAGERRYKAAKMAGLLSVPAIISNLDDNTSAEVAIVENIQRKDLTAIEEAKSYQALLDKGYMTQEDLAKKMGLSQSAISNKLRLLSLSETVQNAILEEKISERHARTLLKIPNHQLQNELLTKTITERLTVKQLEVEVKKLISTSTPVEDEKDIKVEPETPIKEEVINPTIEEVKRTEPALINDVFSQNPMQMPNKFFNFLEDTAANMEVEEIVPVEEKMSESAEIPTTELINQTEEIEMLDDFFVPEQSHIKENSKPEYYMEVINNIRSLDLDSEKVIIEEINLPEEYQITIKIKKEDKN